MSKDSIEIRITPNQIDSGERWSPNQGPVFTRMLEAKTNLTDNEKDKLVRETVSILGNCVEPNANKTVNTGLVIGHVQSGKTLSFTSLAALARDNKYRLVILLAGTTNNLVEQSYDRLERDLDIDRTREWSFFTTRQTAFQKSEVDRVNTELQQWRKRSPRARTVLIVSMKQHQHLKNLATLLAGSGFSDVPTLIIDDEGDQIGINTKAKQNEESTTYTRIKALRNLFPHHSYILYTATPQAPLLISRIDMLSPDFGFVLTPGKNYVGGQEFFIGGLEKYVKTIPLKDVPGRNPPRSPPESLKTALRDFFIGVAIGLLEGEFNERRNRSMMIHPSFRKDGHVIFRRWAQRLKDNWVSILDDTNHPEYESLIEQFRHSAEGIFHTYSIKHSFDKIESTLLEAMERTAIEELNTREHGRIDPVNWAEEYSRIFVGGIGLDRGFTVEGLTVSYMPRSIGVGNADSIQQRGRFFGYKKRYLGLCRLYLTRENIDAFIDYVEHEKSIRDSICTHLRSGKALKEWRRMYFLDPSLRPTRSSVVLLSMYRPRRRSNWIIPDYPFDGTEIVAENRKVACRILDRFKFQPHAEKGWNNEQRIPAFSSSIKLADIIPFIGQFEYKWPDDGLQHAALMLGFEKMVAQEPTVECSYYAFSGPWSGVPSQRTLDDKDPPKIIKLLQGSNPGTKYPGARKIISAEAVTFQLHRYDILNADKKLLLSDVPVLAVHIPNQLIRRIWIER